MTTWHNPTKFPMRVTLARAGRRSTDPDEILTFTIEPGKSGEIPAEFDTAIHRRDADGTVVSGLAPMLVRAGQTYGVHPALIGSSAAVAKFTPVAPAKFNPRNPPEAA